MTSAARRTVEILSCHWLTIHQDGQAGVVLRARRGRVRGAGEVALLTRERADYLVNRYSEQKERELERLSAVVADIGFVKR